MKKSTKNLVTAVFRNHTKAQQAFDRVLARGYSSNEINVLMSDKTRSAYFPPPGRDEAHHEAGSKAAEGMGVGGAVGTAVGATIGAILAVGTSILLPGIGVVAGPIAGALAGGGAGAATGGLIGTLVGYGIPEQNAQAYEAALREGGIVVGVEPHNSQDATDIANDFKELGGESVCSW